jgi:hypothetical protein
MSKNCPDCTPFDDLYKSTVCKDSVPSSCVPYNGANIQLLNITNKDNLNSVIKKITDALENVSDDNNAPVDLSALEAKIAAKASLPDGITKVGTVAISIDTATMSGFFGNYQGLSFALPTSTVALDPKDPGVGHPPYDRIDIIYYNPATKTYGKSTGITIENPVKPIPPTPDNTFKIANVRRNVDGTNIIEYAAIVNFLTTNTKQSVSALKNFNEGIGSDRELLNVLKPINTFWQSGFYVNYQNSYSNGETLFVDDPQSFFGKVVKIPIGSSSPIHPIYGPYENRLAPGEWVYEFRLKVSDNSSNADLIFFDIAVGANTWTNHFLIIKPSDFPNTTEYKTFKMPFTASKGTGYEFRIRTLITPNPIDIYFDYGIAKQALVGDPVKVSELKDVVLTSPSNGQVLKFNGTNWVNAADNVGGGSGGGGDMFAATYDPDGNGVVNDSTKLNNQPGSFYLNRANHIGNISADAVVDGTTNKVFTAALLTKLTNVNVNATVNSSDAFLLSRANHTGPLNADVLVDGATNRLFTTAEKTKLTNIQSGATFNSPDSFLLNRANQIGNQPATTISEDATHRFVTDAEKATWNAKQAAGDYATNTALSSGLSSKQNALVSGVNIKTFGGQSILGTGDIPMPTGGGTGNGDMTKSVYDPTSSGKVTSAVNADVVPWTGISNKPTTFAPTAHTHSQGEITNLSSDLASKAPTLSPVFTGTPTAPNAVAGTNTTQIATTAFVISERSNSATLTNKTISGVNNTFSNIPQSAITNLTSDKLATDTKIGTLTSLSTTNKTDLVSAINEVKAQGVDFFYDNTLLNYIPVGETQSHIGVNLSEVFSKYIAGETPSGAVNGVNKVFSLAFTPVANTESVFKNEGYQARGYQYTISGNTITFVTAPDASAPIDRIRVTYIKQ